MAIIKTRNNFGMGYLGSDRGQAGDFVESRGSRSKPLTTEQAAGVPEQSSGWRDKPLTTKQAAQYAARVPMTRETPEPIVAAGFPAWGKVALAGAGVLSLFYIVKRS